MEKINYYTKLNGQMTRISKEEADKISKYNKSLPYERWNEAKFVFMVKQEKNN